MIDTLISNPEEKIKLFNAMDTLPCVKKKVDWSFKWMNKENSFGERLISFACIEGIFFSGAFCSIFWLKNRNLMTNGLAKSNEFIARDEAMHVEFAVLLYHKLKNRLRQETVYEILSQAVDIEKEFITESLPCMLIGMNSDLMKQYIEFVADRLIYQLGYPKLYNSSNPFDFMENLSLQGKTNFFEQRTTEYQRADVGTNNEDINFDDAF